MKTLVVGLYDFKEKNIESKVVTLSSCRGWSRNELSKVITASACRGWSKNEHSDVIRACSERQPA